MPWFLGNSRAFSSLVDLSIRESGILFLIAWSLLLKGFALWHAARRNEPKWFIALLVINTAGIFEVVYLLFVARVFGETTKTAKQITEKSSIKKAKK